MAIYPVRLVQKRLILPEVFEFHFTKPVPWTFIAGQYINLILPAAPNLPAEHRARRFSPIDTSNEPHLIITTRINSGACSPYKHALTHLPIESEVRVASAQGQFTLATAESSPIVFIAGGIGITPFLSMLREPYAPSVPIHLFYLNQSIASAAYLTELEELAKQRLEFRLTAIESQSFAHPEQALTVIEQALLQSPEWLAGTFYLCGSVGMVTNAHRFLVTQLEIPPNLVKIEEFNGY